MTELARRLALSAGIVLAAPWAHAHDEHAHGAAPKVDVRKAQPTAFGQPGDPKKVTRTVRIDMADTMRFTPAALTVNRGETVRFVVANHGKVMHEMVLGTDKAIAEHAEMMRKSPNMRHDEPHMAHVKPGASGEMVWQFTQAGTFRFACLQPGHFEAGMSGSVEVR